jgi:hypothetical protein
MAHFRAVSGLVSCVETASRRPKKPSNPSPVSAAKLARTVCSDGRMSAYDPLRTLGDNAIHLSMTWKAIIVGIAGVAVLILVMFYGGMFMHGD